MFFRLILTKIYIFYLKILVFFNKKKHNLKKTVKETVEELKDFINDRKKTLNDLDIVKKAYQQKTKSIKLLFEDENFRNEIFNKFSDLWENNKIKKDKELFAIITQVAIANAVIAGLPGKLGIGVVICIALEFYMALAIASKIGVTVSEKDLWSKFKDLSKYGSYFTFVAFIAFWGFKQMLSFVFSLIPTFLPALVIAEYIVTVFTGIMFWTLFEQTRKKHHEDDLYILKFNIKIIYKSYKITKKLLKYQKESLRHTFSVENVIDCGQKLSAWFKGDDLEDYLNILPKIRGNVFVSLAVGHLLIKKYETLDGPLGQLFLKSIRDRWTKLESATNEEISIFMNEAYSQDQIPGVINTIKGKFFENIVEVHENSDGDEWIATLHKDESYPGSDIIMTNLETNETIELSLKASSNPHYIEESLMKYPEIPILTTSELAEEFKDLDMIIASDFRNSEIQEITESNFEELVNNLTPFSRISGATASAVGVAMAAVVSLWPFVAAYKRGKISRDKLEIALIKVFPIAGKELAYRISLFAIFGPLYAWWILARTAMSLTPKPKDDLDTEGGALSKRYLVYKSLN